MENKFFNNLPPSLGQTIIRESLEVGVLEARVAQLTDSVASNAQWQLEYANKIAANTDKNFNKVYLDTLKRDKALLLVMLGLSVISTALGIIF